MQKPTLTKQLEQANQLIRAQQATITTQAQKLAEHEIRLNYLSRMDRRFDQLLEGVCSGLKETSFPRRPS